MQMSHLHDNENRAALRWARMIPSRETYAFLLKASEKVVNRAATGSGITRNVTAFQIEKLGLPSPPEIYGTPSNSTLDHTQIMTRRQEKVNKQTEFQKTKPQAPSVINKRKKGLVWQSCSGVEQYTQHNAQTQTQTHNPPKLNSPPPKHNPLVQAPTGTRSTDREFPESLAAADSNSSLSSRKAKCHQVQRTMELYPGQG